MSYADRATLCSPGSPFQGRVRAAAIDYAVVVTGESSVTADHSIRQAYADMIISDPTGGVTLNLGWVASGDGTNESSDDPTIIARVATVWTTVAVLATRQTASGSTLTSTGS